MANPISIKTTPASASISDSLKYLQHKNPTCLRLHKRLTEISTADISCIPHTTPTTPTESPRAIHQQKPFMHEYCTRTSIIPATRKKRSSLSSQCLSRAQRNTNVLCRAVKSSLHACATPKKRSKQIFLFKIIIKSHQKPFWCRNVSLQQQKPNITNTNIMNLTKK